MNDLKAELLSLVHDETAFLATCQKAMGIDDRMMQTQFGDLEPPILWGAVGGKDLELAAKFVNLLKMINVEPKELEFTHPRWKQDFLVRCNEHRGIEEHAMIGEFCRSLRRHLARLPTEIIEHLDYEVLTDEQVLAMSKDEYIDLVLFSSFPAHDRTKDPMYCLRRKSRGKWFVELYRGNDGVLRRYIHNFPF